MTDASSIPADLASAQAALAARRYYETRLRAALAALVLLSLALALASLWTNQARWRFDDRLRHGLQAMDRISRLSDAISVQAAAFRGHLVQRDAASLLGYQNARESVDRMLETVARDAAERPERRVTAELLRGQLADLHTYYRDLVTLLLDTGHAAAHERYRGNTEDERLAGMAETLATLRLQQERALLLNAAGAQRRDHWLQLALGAALLAQVVLGALLYWTLRGAGRRRRAPSGEPTESFASLPQES